MYTGKLLYTLPLTSSLWTTRVWSSACVNGTTLWIVIVSPQNLFYILSLPLPRNYDPSGDLVRVLLSLLSWSRVREPTSCWKNHLNPRSYPDTPRSLLIRLFFRKEKLNERVFDHMTFRSACHLFIWLTSASAKGKRRPFWGWPSLLTLFHVRS